jgi:hypothetical protein
MAATIFKPAGISSIATQLADTAGSCPSELKEKPMATTDELLDSLMKNCRKPEDLIGEYGLLNQLYKRSQEGARQSEITEERSGYSLSGKGGR